MKKILLWIVFSLMMVAQAAPFDSDRSSPAELKPSQQQGQTAHLAAELLTRYHYKPVPLDDSFSKKIFDRYLKSLDSEKALFVQADIDQLDDMRTKLDDAIIQEDLTLPFTMFNLYTKRVTERLTYARSVLKEGFDFGLRENYQFARDKEPWPKSEVEMRDLWRKRVKNDWLRLKLAGKSDKDIAETLDRRYSTALRRASRVTSKDAFETFMNAYTMAIEPHTNYMGPRTAEDFDISMKLSLVGIGAVLMEKDDYTTIREVVAGGPAALSGELMSGDRILGVAQGKNGLMTDVLGWRLDDTVALIRGAADSIVSLDVLPADAGPDGKHKLVSLIRKKITLEDQAARKFILSMMDGKALRHVGVISLPGFYEDYQARISGDQDFRSATRDVARLLDELKREKVDSILIDLRNNGGGSLKEAIELTGLFIGNGPVVQQRDARGKITVERDKKAGVVWNGPLGVMINRGSASASEIFAAAIQDYGRGLVIGESSFGKGTVQAVINLDEVAKNDRQQFGELKLTVAQFFRINGGTTQLRGVKPDIAFPANTDEEAFGESSYDNALPWTQVKAAEYSPLGDMQFVLPILQKRHEARLKKDKDLQALQEDISEFKILRKKRLVSLNETERRKERNVQEAKLVSRETRNEVGKNNTMRDDGLQPEERNLASELAVEKVLKNAKDTSLNEAARILSDEVGLLEPGVGFVARVKAGLTWIPGQIPDAGASRADAW